jgi:hypothetical protein
LTSIFNRFLFIFSLVNKQTNEFKLSNPSNDFSGASELSKHSFSIRIQSNLNLTGQSKSVAFYSPTHDEEQQILDNITGEKSEKNETVKCTDDEQPIPSTTEYLDGMTHSDSPPGLLPRYSSWSLCCIGRASDYVPTKGTG